MDVIVAGGGPAGWSLAAACARRGLSVTLVAPSTGWRATYGMWLDEVAVLPRGSRYVAARAKGGGRQLPRRYVVLDNDSVLAAFTHPGITVVKGRVGAFAADRVTLADGTVLRGRLVFDATGAPRVAGPRTEQTAYGVVVPANEAAPVVGPGEAVFMDWTRPPGFGEPATFLYAVPLPDGRVLLEETCLARRPGLGMAELRDRLHARLAGKMPACSRSHPGDELAGDVERVRFPVDIPPPPLRQRGPIPFGAAAGLVHPATGFSVADTFRLAGKVAQVAPIGERAVRRVLWPVRARLVYRLRRRGLTTLLALTADEYQEFFDLFFALSDRRQRAYLSRRTDLRGTVTTMAALYRAAPARLRRKMTGR